MEIKLEWGVYGLNGMTIMEELFCGFPYSYKYINVQYKHICFIREVAIKVFLVARPVSPSILVATFIREFFSLA